MRILRVFHIIFQILAFGIVPAVYLFVMALAFTDKYYFLGYDKKIIHLVNTQIFYGCCMFMMLFSWVLRQVNICSNQAVEEKNERRVKMLYPFRYALEEVLGFLMIMGGVTMLWWLIFNFKK